MTYEEVLNEVSQHERLYSLSNGNKLRLFGVDDECPFGWEYYDGETKELLDGGCFDCIEAQSIDDVVKDAIWWATFNVEEDQDGQTEKITAELIMEDADYDTLEELGYSGF